jgi:lysophospholipase L1-like esterase
VSARPGGADGTGGRASGSGGTSPSASPGVAGPSLRYVALGDSYTVGTAADPGDCWPDQLVARLAADPPARTLALVATTAVNGYTSGDVVWQQLPLLDELRPGFVSLLIGVNDVVRRVAAGTYAANVDRILDRLLELVAPNRVVCVETPDYTATPAGSDYGDPATQREAITRNNRILATACEARGIAFVDGIFALSQAVLGDRSLVADDGLHPSGRQYARWVDRIEPVVRELLGRP